MSIGPGWIHTICINQIKKGPNMFGPYNYKLIA